VLAAASPAARKSGRATRRLGSCGAAQLLLARATPLGALDYRTKPAIEALSRAWVAVDSGRVVRGLPPVFRAGRVEGKTAGAAVVLSQPVPQTELAATMMQLVHGVVSPGTDLRERLLLAGSGCPGRRNRFHFADVQDQICTAGLERAVARADRRRSVLASHNQETRSRATANRRLRT
jgi:hypothetical protein